MLQYSGGTRQFINGAGMMHRIFVAPENRQIETLPKILLLMSFQL